MQNILHGEVMFRKINLAIHAAIALVIGLIGFGIPSTSSGEENAKEKKTIVFVAGTRSHGYAAHEHKAGCMLLAKSLESSMGFKTVVYENGWPKDPKAFEGADAVVMYADGGGRHPVNPHIEDFDKVVKKGVGVVCIHYAVETPKGKTGDKFVEWIGGYFETNWSVNPHWTASFEKFPEHPTTRGVKPFAINDEWYYHMRFRDGMKGVTPILSALPPKETLSRRDGPHSGNPHVRSAVLDRKESQHVAWATERADGGRGFGFTGGHVHWNWGDPNFRKLVLNAIVWSAKAEVPKDGVGDERVSMEKLEENQDFPQPATFNREGIQKKFDLPPLSKKVSKRKAPKPIYQSDVVTKKTSGHMIDIRANIQGHRQLFLVASDAGDGYSCDWANWVNPRVRGPKGVLKLTELKWKSASTSFGQVSINRNAGGKPMKINGKRVSGIGTHANSVIVYDIPEGYTTFHAKAGLDNGGTDQGACGDMSSVRFSIYGEKPSFASLGGQSRDAEDAVAGLDVADGLKAELFAAEPNVLSLANIDIDHRGRVWACEIVNYRRHKGKRAEGDRIIICEDTNGNGTADSVKTFYQDPSIDSPHGVLVLPTLDGKNTKVLVSANESVFVLTDTDGDDKADKKEVLFTGISGTQHDHGIHAFVFGPDGKLYFNFGNAGKQIKDKNGKPIVDKAGNQVNNRRKPYQEGMVFRCDIDGSNFETLGWNFRNNWEVCVDSFGSIWQSDNDDDGNKGVRINYVMEFGNYGYKDEFTGAGWQAKRTGMSAEIPLKHWHLNDPGVMPNLLQTGAGSPTGILVYEGDLLPASFRNQMIHCDAGPNVVRAYPVKNAGAGYSATTINILQGARDKWFRPSDVCVAPDGSLFVADWYDPGVGGHAMGDLDRGRIFRVAPPNSKYKKMEFKYDTAENAAVALLNANLTVRYLAWNALHEMGSDAEAALTKVYKSENPRHRARALWLLGKIDGKQSHYVKVASVDKDPNIRITAIRLARQNGYNMMDLVEQMIEDDSPQVRRELLVALSEHKGDQAAKHWAKLATKFDGQDRWYLEALGIAARGNWDNYLDAYIKLGGVKPKDKSFQGIVWRSRATQTPMLLATILKSGGVDAKSTDKFMRAFDFLKGPQKDKALESLLEIDLE